MRRHLPKILIVAAVAVILTAVFLLEGRADAPAEVTAANPAATTEAPATTAPPMATTSPPETTEPPASTAPPETTVPTTTAPDTTVAQTTAPPEGNPPPVDEPTVTDRAMTCTLTIRCGTLLDNLDRLDEEKHELVPDSGLLLDVTATFYEGESVFNVLTRETRRAKLHLEYVNTPIYRSAYIQGIGNLYEFDCGELSGWTYNVNGWFPNYGCSRYALADGDAIMLAYTCDLGEDVGGYNYLEPVAE